MSPAAVETENRSRASVRAVFLVGFMGAGKSSVGRALAKRLKWKFEDLDARVEQNEGCSVAEIFRDSGEAKFREAERFALRHVLEELAQDSRRIVGLGGGAFVQPENAAMLESAGVLTVFLDAPADELWRRCVRQNENEGWERPLRRSFEQFQSLCENRREGYLKASLRIETRGRSIAAIAREIAEVLTAQPAKSKARKEGQS